MGSEKSILIFFLGIICAASIGCTDINGDVTDEINGNPADDSGKETALMEENISKEKAIPIMKLDFSKNMEVDFGSHNAILKITSKKSDSNKITIKLNSTEGITLSDEKIEIEQILKDEEKIIDVSFKVLKPGNDEISFFIDSKDSENVSGSINITSRVQVPIYEVGEYWVNNISLEGFSIFAVSEVIGEEEVDGVPAYVIKTVSDGDIKGNYDLDYFSKSDLSLIKSENYENNKLEKEKNCVPPLLNWGFPLELKKTWDYSGTLTGVGRVNLNGIVNSYVKKNTPAGEFDTYKYRNIMSLPMGGTVETEGYYSPEVKDDVYSKLSVTGGVKSFIESEIELVEYGRPPKKAPDIQINIEIPSGFELYRNDELGFLMAHPANWDVDVESNDEKDYYYVYFHSRTQSYVVTVDLSGFDNLSEFKDFRMEFVEEPFTAIDGPNDIIINERNGYTWKWDDRKNEGVQYVFERNGVGYLISVSWEEKEDSSSLLEVFNKSRDTFFIIGSKSTYSLE